MEIPKQQFHQQLPAVEEAIKECDFLAIDTELSGKHEWKKETTHTRVAQLISLFVQPKVFIDLLIQCDFIL